MSRDPAIAAAQRAWESDHQAVGAYRPGYDEGFRTPAPMEAAADEALKPLRAKVEQLRKDYPNSDSVRRVLDELAPLIYHAAELGR